MYPGISKRVAVGQVDESSLDETCSDRARYVRAESLLQLPVALDKTGASDGVRELDDCLVGDVSASPGHNVVLVKGGLDGIPLLLHVQHVVLPQITFLNVALQAPYDLGDVLLRSNGGGKSSRF